jgi:hypothetical protein
MAGIVSYNGMWVTVEPSAEVVNSYTIEWECTSVGQTIWGAVIAETETVSINVSYEEAIVVVIPEYDYENVVTPEEFVYNGDTANFDYVETFDDIVDNAVLGDDGYYHLNSADGPVLFACLNDDIMSLVGANTYGQLTYVEYDEDGNIEEKTECKYDKNGNCTLATGYDSDGNILGKAERKYDKDNNLTFVAYYDEDGNITNKYEYKYDKNGNCTLITYYNKDLDSEGKEEITEGKVEYKYDKNGNCTLATEYDKDGNFLGKTEYINPRLTYKPQEDED